MDLVNKAENNSFINDEYFDYYRIYKCFLLSLHRVYIKTNLSINSLSFMTKKCRISLQLKATVATCFEKDLPSFPFNTVVFPSE